MGHPVKFSQNCMSWNSTRPLHSQFTIHGSRNKKINKQLTVICGFGAHYLILNVLIFGFTLKITILMKFQEEMWNRYQRFKFKNNFSLLSKYLENCKTSWTFSYSYRVSPRIVSLANCDCSSKWNFFWEHPVFFWYSFHNVPCNWNKWKSPVGCSL